MTHPLVEPVRLIIWDLDETFWAGTLTEGGHIYARATHDIVITLAQRGIISSICSKNDEAPVREILQNEGIWPYFVFPSINWQPKGPRLAELITQIQLRPESVLFIDDNLMNLAEARHYVPGLQTAEPTIIPHLLAHPLLRGKDDSALTRLHQYQMLQQRAEKQRDFGNDTTEFLRQSGIRVTIEHDLAPHLDRAIELINRTNQLNYLKKRLPEDPAAARAELQTLLSSHEVQAGILRVRDNYGDYGYCGLYIIKTGGGWKKLLQFCFSCRILNMGVETWLYHRLGRPPFKPVGEVLSDIIRDKREINWIELEIPGIPSSTNASEPALPYFFARGGCDLLAVSHYFNMLAEEVHGEYSTVRNGAFLRFEHSMITRYALQGVSPAQATALGYFGFEAADFKSFANHAPRNVPGIWLLSFWADADYAVYRHKTTGIMAPLALPGIATNMRNLITLHPEDSGADPAFVAMLKQEFDYVGPLPEAEFRANLRLILGKAPPAARIFILLANEIIPRAGKPPAIAQNKRRQNEIIAEEASAFANTQLLRISDFIADAQELSTVNHFDRMVYFRVFRHITAQFA